MAAGRHQWRGREGGEGPDGAGQVSEDDRDDPVLGGTHMAGERERVFGRVQLAEDDVGVIWTAVPACRREIAQRRHRDRGCGVWLGMVRPTMSTEIGRSARVRAQLVGDGLGEPDGGVAVAVDRDRAGCGGQIDEQAALVSGADASEGQAVIWDVIRQRRPGQVGRGRGPGVVVAAAKGSSAVAPASTASIWSSPSIT